MSEAYSGQARAQRNGTLHVTVGQLLGYPNKGLAFWVLGLAFLAVVSLPALRNTLDSRLRDGVNFNLGFVATPLNPFWYPNSVAVFTSHIRIGLAYPIIALPLKRRTSKHR